MVQRLMATRTITEENLGAWLIKCDPNTKYDLPGAIAAGIHVVTNWSVADNYRSRMMAPGDRIILWVSGDGRIMDRGIWGIGHVTGYVHDTVHEEDPESGENSFWHNEEDRLAVTNDIAVNIPVFEDAVTGAELKAAGIVDLEVQRAAQSSNPSWVSREQLAALEPLLGPWPDELEPEEEITVSAYGAGFGNPLQNEAVEEAAMDAVIEYYEGWAADDVSLAKVGWDITFTDGSGEIRKVEVKGVSGDRPIVLLTANEVRAAQFEEGWVLAIVTRALSMPTVVEYFAPDVITKATPYVYKANLDRPIPLIVYE
ncbi:DUF3883 domain-containing protein [Nocardioides aurantiacus]|uniref:DUF3883 domain-containing protein n=1 Tax=Nocardioides aurantiacus TaxID=86796 RepID=UPI00403F87C5